jgi:uncharacterized phage infection (PIP) family protein YhgE
MANLSKLDETIDQLEKQAQMLKQNNGVLAKVSELAKSIEKGVAELSTGNDNFEVTKKDVQNSLKSLNDSVTNLEKENERHIDSIITANKKYLTELEEIVSSKIKRFSSDIEVTIRQERSQLQESLQNSLTTHFNRLEEKHSKQISLLRNLLVAGLIISIGILVVLFLR